MGPAKLVTLVGPDRPMAEGMRLAGDAARFSSTRSSLRRPWRSAPSITSASITGDCRSPARPGTAGHVRPRPELRRRRLRLSGV